MKFKTNYIVIPLITIATALLGSLFTTQGMAWYETELLLPSITPPKFVFPIVWNLIFILTTISALIFWKKRRRIDHHDWITTFFIFNAVLNVFWSFLFFGQHQIFMALVEIIPLWASILTLVVCLWSTSKTASLLLTPYLVWVAIATYLNYQLWLLN